MKKTIILCAALALVCGCQKPVKPVQPEYELQTVYWYPDTTNAEVYFVGVKRNVQMFDDMANIAGKGGWEFVQQVGPDTFYFKRLKQDTGHFSVVCTPITIN